MLTDIFLGMLERAVFETALRNRGAMGNRQRYFDAWLAHEQIKGLRDERCYVDS